MASIERARRAAAGRATTTVVAANEARVDESVADNDLQMGERSPRPTDADRWEASVGRVALAWFIDGERGGQVVPGIQDAERCTGVPDRLATIGGECDWLAGITMEPTIGGGECEWLGTTIEPAIGGGKCEWLGTTIEPTIGGECEWLGSTIEQPERMLNFKGPPGAAFTDAARTTGGGSLGRRAGECERDAGMPLGCMVRNLLAAAAITGFSRLWRVAVRRAARRSGFGTLTVAKVAILM